MSLARNHGEPHRKGIDKAMATLRVQLDAVEEMWRRLAASLQVRFSAVAPTKCQNHGDGFLTVPMACIDKFHDLLSVSKSGLPIFTKSLHTFLQLTPQRVVLTTRSNAFCKHEL